MRSSWEPRTRSLCNADDGCRMQEDDDDDIVLGSGAVKAWMSLLPESRVYKHQARVGRVDRDFILFLFIL